MAQLDKFIEKVQAGQEIMLEAGKAPVLKAESGSVPMTNQALSAAQITALVLELAPAELRDAVTQRRPAKFDYAAGIKTVIVVFSPEAEPLTARIYSGVRRSDTAFAAPQPSAAAPHAPEPGINVLLRRMFKLGASDLHLTSSHRPMVRVNGDMQELADLPVMAPEHLSALLEAIMPRHNSAQFAELHDTDFAYEIPKLSRFRANVFMDRFGMGAVFRQVPVEIVTAEKLCLSKEILDLCFLSKGLVLVTGPTGSGKLSITHKCQTDSQGSSPPLNPSAASIPAIK